MKKITKITFYSLGIMALAKATKYFLDKNKKIQHENYVQKESCCSELLCDECYSSCPKNKNTYERKYTDITEVLSKNMNKGITKCKK